MEALALSHIVCFSHVLEQSTERLLCCGLPVRLQRGAEQVLWLRDWRASAES